MSKGTRLIELQNSKKNGYADQVIFAYVFQQAWSTTTRNTRLWFLRLIQTLPYWRSTASHVVTEVKAWTKHVLSTIGTSLTVSFHATCRHPHEIWFDDETLDGAEPLCVESLH